MTYNPKIASKDKFCDNHRYLDVQKRSDPQLLLPIVDKLRQLQKQNGTNNTISLNLADCLRQLGKLDEVQNIYASLFNDKMVNIEKLETITPKALFRKGFQVSPLIIADDLLDNEVFEKVLQATVDLKDQFAPAIYGHEKLSDDSVRSGLMLKSFEHASFLHSVSSIIYEYLPHIQSQLGLAGKASSKLGLTVSAQLDSGHFVPHIDIPEEAKGEYNRFNFVYYYSDPESDFEGGELVVFDTDTRADDICYSEQNFTTISPKRNRLVIFPSNFVHSAMPTYVPSGKFEYARFAFIGQINLQLKND